MSRKNRRILLVANEVPDDAALDELINGSGILVVAPASAKSATIAFTRS